MYYRRVRLGQIGNDPVITFAVQELCRCLKQMDSNLLVDVLQTDRAISSFEKIVWVGMDESFASDLLLVEDPDMDDAIAIEVTDSKGFITGSNKRSVLIAAYRFLKELGCDWIRPGRSGERIPDKKIEKIDIRIQECASYRHRGICIEGANTYENIADMIDYLPKIGMNEYFIQFMTPYRFFERFYSPSRNPIQEPVHISREEVDAMTVSLENEILRRGLCYHKTGHGWTCEPLGINGTGWGKLDPSCIDESIIPFFAEIKGKRSLWLNMPLATNLCYSNPKVRDIITDAITNYLERNTHIDVLHFWLADGQNNHCECEYCKQMLPADWYLTLLNELDEKMSRAGIHTRVVFLLYYDLLWKPEHTKLKNQDRFIMMFAPITRIYGENYVEHLEFDGELPRYSRNRNNVPKTLNESLAYLYEWQKEFTGDSFLFDYHLMWAHVADPGYELCALNLYEDMKNLDAMGLNGMISCQVQRCAFPTALPLNTMAAALWNKNCDYESIADKYYLSAFGPEGKLARQYLAAISKQIRVYESQADGYPTFDKKPMCLNYEYTREMIERILPVIGRNIQGQYEAEWKKLRIHTEYMTRLLNCLECLEEGDSQKVREMGLDLADFVNRIEFDIQGQIDGFNTHRVLLRRLGLKDNMVPEIRAKRY